MNFNISKLAYLPKTIPKSQGNATAPHQRDTAAHSQNVSDNRKLARGSSISLSPGLQNLLNSPVSLKGDWTDRFSVLSGRLGASSFVELGAATFASDTDRQLQSAIHGTLIYNSHATYRGVQAASRNLEYLNEIGKSFGTMINAFKASNGAGAEQIRALAYDFEDGADRAAFYAGAAVREFGAAVDTLSLNTEEHSAAKLVLDSSGFTNTLLNKDYSLNEFRKMSQGPGTGPVGGEAAAPSGASDVLNSLFSDEVSSDGNLVQGAPGVTNGNFAELASDPEKRQAVLAKLETAFANLKETIVSQGEQYKELKRADDYYERSLNEYDEGRYGVQALEDLKLAVQQQYSAEEKNDFLADFWSNLIAKNRERTIFEWLEKVKKDLDSGKGYEPLDLDKGNEQLLQTINAFAQLTDPALSQQTGQTERDAKEDADSDDERTALSDDAEARKVFIADAEEREAFLDDALNLIFNSGIDYKTGSFGEPGEGLIQDFSDLVASQAAPSQTQS